MAIVLGPEVNIFLREIGEDLTGKPKLNFVDTDTIVRSLASQNQVIQMLLKRILELEGMQTTVAELQRRLDHSEKYTKKIGAIEATLTEKIPLLDKIDEVVKCHDSIIDKYGTNLKQQSDALDTFSSDAKEHWSQTTQDLAHFRSKMDVLPETIMISSRQVTHSLIEKGKTSKKDLLLDIIAQQEQNAYLQDERTNEIKSRLEDHITDQIEHHGKIEEDIGLLSKWRDDQRNLDLGAIKSDQDAMKNTLDEHEQNLVAKMSKEDVKSCLDGQFKSIVNHLQSALDSVNRDEEDFRSVSETLNKMCQTLRDSKADKTEISTLRRQFIDNQINVGDLVTSGSIPNNGQNFDNEAIRMRLKDVKKMIVSKLDQDKAHREFEKINSNLAALEATIHKMLASSSQIQLQENAYLNRKSLSRAEEATISNEDFTNDRHMLPFRLEEDNRMVAGELSTLNGIDKMDFASNLPKVKTKKRRGRRRKNFPSSNLLKSPLNNIPPQENNALKGQRLISGGDYSSSDGERIRIRPISAPQNLESSTAVAAAKNKQSLPNILTSIGRNMRNPRGRVKSAKSRKQRQKMDISIEGEPNNSVFVTAKEASHQYALTSSNHFSELPPVAVRESSSKSSGLSGRLKYKENL